MQPFFGFCNHRQMFFVGFVGAFRQHRLKLFTAAAHTRFGASARNGYFHCELAFGAFVQFPDLIFHDLPPSVEGTGYSILQQFGLHYPVICFTKSCAMP
jgi:hypothetical protein